MSTDAMWNEFMGTFAAVLNDKGNLGNFSIFGIYFDGSPSGILTVHGNDFSRAKSSILDMKRTRNFGDANRFKTTILTTYKEFLNQLGCGHDTNSTFAVVIHGDNNQNVFYNLSGESGAVIDMIAQGIQYMNI